MREYNFKASDNNGEMLMGLSFPFSFMGIAGLILILRLHLFPKIKFFQSTKIIFITFTKKIIFLWSYKKF